MSIIALVVGHTQKRQGAYNKKYDMSEFVFNKMIANWIQEYSGIGGIEIVYRDTYKELPFKINELNPDIILSLHCNADGTRTASGSETLYYYSSELGKEIATITQKNVVDALELPNRGIKAKTHKDRGGYLLRHTKAPCVIVEPFFLTTNREYKYIRSRIGDLIEAYVISIRESLVIV